MISRIILPIVIALGLCIPQFAHAGFPTPRPKRTPSHHHTVIESVSADSITISASGGDKTYKITTNTEITFKGETVTADKLAVGMRVSVTPDAADEESAGQISANDPPHDPATPAPK
jgi:hypothetical protein